MPNYGTPQINEMVGAVKRGQPGQARAMSELATGTRQPNISDMVGAVGHGNPMSAAVMGQNIMGVQPRQRRGTKQPGPMIGHGLPQMPMPLGGAIGGSNPWIGGMPNWGTQQGTTNPVTPELMSGLFPQSGVGAGGISAPGPTAAYRGTGSWRPPPGYQGPVIYPGSLNPGQGGQGLMNPGSMLEQAMRGGQGAPSVADVIRQIRLLQRAGYQY